LRPSSWYERPRHQRRRAATGEHVAWLLAPLPDTDLELARGIRDPDAHPERVRAATMGGAFAFPAEGDHVTFNDPDIPMWPCAKAV
jgi:hypothetical protein